MNKKKILKVCLIVLISLILVIILSLAAIYQFVIKPHSEEIIATIEQVVNDPGIVGESEQAEIAEDLLAEKIISDYNKTITVARLGYNTEENKLTVECM